MPVGQTGRRRFLVRAAGLGAALAATALASPAKAAKANVVAPAVRASLRAVALDPGHGGHDPGAIGVKGTHEKHVTLAVATDLAKRLEATGRYRVLLTRRTDDFIPLPERVHLARRDHAQLFLSMHADSAGNHNTRGFSVYTLSEDASDDLAAALAHRENAVDEIGGINLAQHSKAVNSILIDLMRRETSNNSIAMAESVLQQMCPPFAPLQKPHREANFAVLRAPDIPSALVEMGFLSNPADEFNLREPSYQRHLAERLARSIDGYFQTV